MSLKLSQTFLHRGIFSLHRTRRSRIPARKIYDRNKLKQNARNLFSLIFLKVSPTQASKRKFVCHSKSLHWSLASFTASIAKSLCHHYNICSEAKVKSLRAISTSLFFSLIEVVEKKNLKSFLLVNHLAFIFAFVPDRKFCLELTLMEM